MQTAAKKEETCFPAVRDISSAEGQDLLEVIQWPMARIYKKDAAKSTLPPQISLPCKQSRFRYLLYAYSLDPTVSGLTDEPSRPHSSEIRLHPPVSVSEIRLRRPPHPQGSYAARVLQRQEVF